MTAQVLKLKARAAVYVDEVTTMEQGDAVSCMFFSPTQEVPIVVSQRIVPDPEHKNSKVKLRKLEMAECWQLPPEILGVGPSGEIDEDSEFAKENRLVATLAKLFPPASDLSKKTPGDAPYILNAAGSDGKTPGPSVDTQVSMAPGGKEFIERQN